MQHKPLPPASELTDNIGKGVVLLNNSNFDISPFDFINEFDGFLIWCIYNKVMVVDTGIDPNLLPSWFKPAFHAEMCDIWDIAAGCLQIDSQLNVSYPGTDSVICTPDDAGLLSIQVLL